MSWDIETGMIVGKSDVAMLYKMIKSLVLLYALLDICILIYCDMLYVSDPLMKGVMISNGVIGGIVGGLLFLFVVIVMAVMAVRIFNKRRQRERAMRYGK